MDDLDALYARYDGPLPLSPAMTGVYCWEMLLRRHLAARRTQRKDCAADTMRGHTLIRRLRACL